MNTGEDLLSESPSEGNIGLTRGGGNRGSIGFEEGVKTMIMLTRPISKGDMSHPTKRGEVVI